MASNQPWEAVKSCWARKRTNFGSLAFCSVHILIFLVISSKMLFRKVYTKLVWYGVAVELTFIQLIFIPFQTFLAYIHKYVCLCIMNLAHSLNILIIYVWLCDTTAVYTHVTFTICIVSTTTIRLQHIHFYLSIMLSTHK